MTHEDCLSNHLLEARRLQTQYQAEPLIYWLISLDIAIRRVFCAAHARFTRLGGSRNGS